MALAIFKHFPEDTNEKGAQKYVIAKAFPKAAYSKDDEPKMWEKWLRDHGRMRRAYETDVWNPRPSGLCKKHCVVLSCPHNGRS